MLVDVRWRKEKAETSGGEEVRGSESEKRCRMKKQHDEAENIA